MSYQIFRLLILLRISYIDPRTIYRVADNGFTYTNEIINKIGGIIKSILGISSSSSRLIK